MVAVKLPLICELEIVVKPSPVACAAGVTQGANGVHVYVWPEAGKITVETVITSELNVPASGLVQFNETVFFLL